MLDLKAAARAERLAVHVAAALPIARRAVGGERGARVRVAHRQAAQRGRGADVRLQQRRRDAERAADVVEAADGIVAGQQCRDVDGQLDEITHGVRVLRAVQAAQTRHTGIRRVARRGIERLLEKADEAGEALVIGPRLAGRRHQSAA